uniref:Uncharacterized protein n=1 Tax=Romanomermis culicivorax TaxID=13658 RepID=A0A915L3Y2_ROMCU
MRQDAQPANNEQLARQKEHQIAGQASLTTGGTVIPTKHSSSQMKTAQTSMPPSQVPPAQRSDYHRSRHDSYQRDDQHHRRKDKSRCRDDDFHDSHDHDHHGTAPHH